MLTVINIVLVAMIIINVMNVNMDLHGAQHKQNVWITAIILNIGMERAV